MHNALFLNFKLIVSNADTPGRNLVDSDSLQSESSVFFIHFAVNDYQEPI